MTEIYEIINGIAPLIMNSLLSFHTNIYNIRNFEEIFTKNRKTVKYGTETVTHRAPFFWENLQSEYENAKSLEDFKSTLMQT